MFIGVSMQLQAVFEYFLSHIVGRLPLKKKRKKKEIANMYDCDKINVEC